MISKFVTHEGKLWELENAIDHNLWMQGIDANIGILRSIIAKYITPEVKRKCYGSGYATTLNIVAIDKLYKEAHAWETGIVQHIYRERAKVGAAK